MCFTSDDGQGGLSSLAFHQEEEEEEEENDLWIAHGLAQPFLPAKGLESRRAAVPSFGQLHNAAKKQIKTLNCTS